MDSGSSSSMQSSSGGDEEYDSRAQSQISPFLNTPSHFLSISNPLPPSLSLQGSQPPTFFDIPPPLNLDAFSQSPTNQNANVQYNLDFMSSRGLRSEPRYTDFGNLKCLSSSSSSAAVAASSATQALIGAQGLTQGSFPSSSSPQSDQYNMAKNPKKRTRASRRAPTTVLTTDITNFRQMVQEFTGIPTAPFSGTSPYSRRLDLFGTGSAMRSGHLDTMGSLYLRQPSAHKFQLSPYISSASSAPPLLSSSMVDAIAPAATNIDRNMNGTNSNSFVGISNIFSSTSNSYQPPLDIGPQKQPQNTSNLQNSVLTFQSLLQSPLPPAVKHSLGNAPIFNTKSQGSSSIPSLGDLSTKSNNEPINSNNSGFPSQGSSHGLQERNVNNPTRWTGEGSMNYGDQQQLGSLSGNNGNPTHARGYNMLSCSAPTSDFHPEKGLENF